MSGRRSARGSMPCLLQAADAQEDLGDRAAKAAQFWSDADPEPQFREKTAALRPDLTRRRVRSSGYGTLSSRSLRHTRTTRIRSGSIR